MTKENTEFEKFDAVMTKILSVPRKELERRERKWKKQREKAKKKRAKT